MRYVLGVEAMQSGARSDRTGLCVIERAPWGVIGMILPATHSVPTMVSNAINILAAGNTAVFSPHPAGARVAALRAAALQPRDPARDRRHQRDHDRRRAEHRSAEQIFRHPDVALLCVTGGPAVVKAAAQTGKRVIARRSRQPARRRGRRRGPRPRGAVDHRGRRVRQQPPLHRREGSLRRRVAWPTTFHGHDAGRRRAARRAAIEKLTEAAFTFDGAGQGLRPRAREARPARPGRRRAGGGRRGERACGHRAAVRRDRRRRIPSCSEEQMMPFLPIVRVPDIDAAIGRRRAGGARLPAHGDHAHAERRARHRHGARAQHDAVRAERALDRRARRRTARATSATRSPRRPARASRRR